MAKSDWLSIEEITRLWGEETGHDTSAFRKDLEDWFAEFVKQPPAAQSQPLISGTDAGATNRLMGMLGARYLEKTTFEAYCRERGVQKPRFWFDDPDYETGRESSRSPEPQSPPDATPAPSGRARSRDSDEENSELAAFQSQIARLRDSLETPKLGTPGPKKRSESDPPGQAAERKATGSSAAHTQRELIERAAAAAREADALRARLQAAEQQISDRSAESRTSRDSPMAPPTASGSPPPHGHRDEGPPHREPRWPSPVDYRDPSATRQLLRASSSRRRRRLRAVVTVTLGVAFLAVAFWGLETATKLARDQQVPIASDTADAMAGRSSTDRELTPTEPTPEAPVERVQPDSAASSIQSPSLAADSNAAASDLAAAEQQIAMLNQAVEASDKTVARLQDELAIARQAVELARQSGPADAVGWTRDEHLAFQALSTEVAMARRELEDARQLAASNRVGETQHQEQSQQAAAMSAELDTLKKSLEANRQETTELNDALSRVNAEAASLRTALKQAEEQVSEANNGRLAAEAAAAAAADARTSLTTAKEQIAALDEKLDAAFESVAESNKNAAEARSMVMTLRTENARLTDKIATANEEASDLRADLDRNVAEAETKQQEPNLIATAASAHAAALQRELDAARRQISDLSTTAMSAEDEAARLRAELADRQQKVVAAQAPTSQPLELLNRAVSETGGLGSDGQPDPSPADAATQDGGGTSTPDQLSLDDQTDPDGSQQAVTGPDAPKIEELLTSADVSSDPTTSAPTEPAGDAGAQMGTDSASSPDMQAIDKPTATGSMAVPPPPPYVEPATGSEQVAGLELAATAPQTDETADSVAPDDLLVDPASHLGREVEVTGSVVWLLWRYRLQSDGGAGSLVIDVDGLRPAERNELKAAVDRAGLLGAVRARIQGTIERESATSYRLAASKLLVIE